MWTVYPDVKAILSADKSIEPYATDEINNLGTAKPAFMKLLDEMVSLTGDASVVKSTTGDVGLGPEDQVAKIREDFRAKRISQETANARINTVWAQSKN